MQYKQTIVPKPWPTRIQNLKPTALAVPKIFRGCNILKCHVTVTTPISGVICDVVRLTRCKAAVWTVDDVIKWIFKTFQLAGCSTGCVTGCIVYTHLKKPKHVTCHVFAETRPPTWICMGGHTRNELYILGFIKISLGVLKPQGSKFALSRYFGYWLLQHAVVCWYKLNCTSCIYFYGVFIEYFFIVFHITRLCRLMTFVGLIVGNIYFENTITTVYTVLSCKLCNDCILMTTSLQLCILGYWVVLVN